MINRKDIDKLIGNQLEEYKHPVFYEVIDAIPKTSSEKIQRLLLQNKSGENTTFTITKQIRSIPVIHK